MTGNPVPSPAAAVAAAAASASTVAVIVGTGTASAGSASAHPQTLSPLIPAALVRRGKRGRDKTYAVVIGRQVGLFLSWADCEQSIKGYSNAMYHAFDSDTAARAYLAAHGIDPDKLPAPAAVAASIPPTTVINSITATTAAAAATPPNPTLATSTPLVNVTGSDDSPHAATSSRTAATSMDTDNILPRLPIRTHA